MIIVTDIDHTISDALWRDELIPAAKETGNWDEYYTAQDRDQPIYPMMAAVKLFSKTPGCKVIGLTGRTEKWRKSTQLWLWRHGLVLEDLLMRPNEDHTPTAELKVRLLMEFCPDLCKISAVLEDRNDCVTAFKNIGLNVIQYHDARRDNAHHEKIVK